MFINIKKINLGTSLFNLVLTLACPVECDHCQFLCTASKKPEKWMKNETIERTVKEFYKNGIKIIRITGGEPFYDMKRLQEALNIITKYYKRKNIILATSGFWANDNTKTKEILGLVSKKVSILEVSVDRYHMKRVPLENIKRILKESKKNDLNIVLRPDFDIHSKHLIAPIKSLVIKYNTKILFSVNIPVGKASLLEKNVIGYNKILDNFVLNLKRFKKDQLINWVLTAVQLTVFPSGNIYGCCVASKNSYLGNINNETFVSIINKFMNSFPGYAFKKKCSCFSIIRNYLPPFKNLNISQIDHCAICQNQPFVKNGSFDNEYIGTKYINVNLKRLKLIEKEYRGGHKFLLSFNLSQEDLNEKVGKEIIKTLIGLKNKRILFEIAKPLPKCLFKKNGKNVIGEFDMPKNCFECRELFLIKNHAIYFCPNVYNKKGPRLDDVRDRKQIFEHFEHFHSKIRKSNRCLDCISFKRKQCNGLCINRNL